MERDLTDIVREHIENEEEEPTEPMVWCAYCGARIQQSKSFTVFIYSQYQREFKFCSEVHGIYFQMGSEG